MEPIPGTFGWIDTFTSDTDAARDFYEGLFGWESDDRPTEVSGFDYTGFHLAGHNVAGMSEIPPEMSAEGLLPQWMSYVIVEDADATCEDVRASDGQVMLSPMDVMGQGRLANLLDPAGGFFGIWQPYDHAGVDIYNVPGALTWNELQTRDLAAALPFYEHIFGWRWQPGRPPDYHVAMLGERAVAGAEAMPRYVPEEVPAVWLTYFAVADVAQTCERVRELGGKVFPGPTETIHGTVAGILDPNGGRFMVVSR